DVASIRLIERPCPRDAAGPLVLSPSTISRSSVSRRLPDFILFVEEQKKVRSRGGFSLYVRAVFPSIALLPKSPILVESGVRSCIPSPSRFRWGMAFAPIGLGEQGCVVATSCQLVVVTPTSWQLVATVGFSEGWSNACVMVLGVDRNSGCRSRRCRRAKT